MPAGDGSAPSLRPGGQETCPAHGRVLSEGFIGRLVEIVGVGTTAHHVKALFCLAPGCQYKRVKE